MVKFRSIDDYKLYAANSAANKADILNGDTVNGSLYLISEDVLVYDLTGSTAVVTDISDLSADQEITVYVQNGEVVYITIDVADIFE